MEIRTAHEGSRLGAWPLPVLFGLLATGCASTQSMVTSTYVTSGNVREGVLYAIPRQRIVFTLERRVVTRTELEKAQAAARTALAEATAKVTAYRSQSLEPLEIAIRDAPAPSTDDARAALERQKLELEIAKLRLLALQASERKARATLQVARERVERHQHDGLQDRIAFTPGKPYPDPDRRFVALIQDSRGSSEKLELKTTAAGLLSGGTGTSSGQVDEIFVELARAVGAIGALAGRPTGQAFLATPSAEPSGACRQAPLSIRYAFDPFDDEEVRGLQGELDDKQACIDVEVLDTRPAVDPATHGNPEGTFGGLLYPRTVSLRFRITSQRQDGYHRHSYALAEVIDPSVLGFIPLPRATFADNRFEFAFEDGLLTRYQAEQPNQVVTALSAIPRAGAALLSIPAELLQLKIDYSSKESGYYEARTAALEARLAYEAAVAAEGTDDPADQD